jgi:hypothetical protein
MTVETLTSRFEAIYERLDEALADLDMDRVDTLVAERTEILSTWQALSTGPLSAPQAERIAARERHLVLALETARSALGTRLGTLHRTRRGYGRAQWLR